jgi:hypothetical protein
MFSEKSQTKENLKIVCMKKVLILMFLLPLTVYSQNFTKKEIKRFEKVLKRSSAMIKEFDKNSLVSVERLSSPDMEGLIENALFMAGYEVVSNKVAKDAVNVSSRTTEEAENTEISRSTTYKSVYVITVSGQYYQGGVIGRCQTALLTFSARIVDLSDEGRLVGTFKFIGNAMTYVACTEDVANAFAYKLLQLSEGN